MAAYKTIKQKMSIYAVCDAIEELQTLRDEMRDICDNMSGMEHLPKYEAADEAANNLDSYVDNISDLDSQLEEILGEDLPDIEVVQEVPTRRGYSTSRAVRCSNAVAILTTAAEHLRDMDLVGDRQLARDNLCDELEAMEDCNSTEFPGFYG